MWDVDVMCPTQSHQNPLLRTCQVLNIAALPPSSHQPLQPRSMNTNTWTWQPGGIIIPLQWSKGGNGWGVRHGPRHLHLNYPCSEQAGFLNSACTSKLRSCVCPQTQIHTHSGRWHDMSLTARSNTMGPGHNHIHKQTTNVQNGVHMLRTRQRCSVAWLERLPQHWLESELRPVWCRRRRQPLDKVVAQELGNTQQQTANS